MGRLARFAVMDTLFQRRIFCGKSMRPKSGGIKKLAMLVAKETRQMHPKWISIRQMVHCLMMRLNCYRMMALMLAECTDLRPRTLRTILLMMENYESNNWYICI